MIENLSASATIEAEKSFIQLDYIRRMGLTDDGGFIISGRISGTSCGYISVLPISNKEYRQQHPEPSGFCRRDETTLIVISTYRQAALIISSKEVVDSLVSSCQAAELPELLDNFRQ